MMPVTASDKRRQQESRVENLPFLEKEYEVTTENGGFQMNGR